MPLDRSSFKATLLQQIRDALDAAGEPNVYTSRAWPGQQTQREHVWLDATDGPLAVRAMSGPRLPKPQRDEYTVDIIFRSTADGVTPGDAEDRVETIVNIVNDRLAACSFEAPTGPVFAGMFHISRFRGPNSDVEKGTGWVGWAVLTVSVKVFVG